MGIAWVPVKYPFSYRNGYHFAFSNALKENATSLTGPKVVHPSNIVIGTIPNLISNLSKAEDSYSHLPDITWSESLDTKHFIDAMQLPLFTKGGNLHMTAQPPRSNTAIPKSVPISIT